MAKEYAKKAAEVVTALLSGVWAHVSGADGGEQQFEIPIDEQPDMLEMMDKLR